jgi:hypothetical protein
MLTTAGLAACSDDSGPASRITTPGTVAIAAVHEHFDYYGACGSETALVDGVTYFRVLPEHLAEIDEARYPLTTAATSGLLAAVPVPGPGDDVGTLIVYADGMARYESDSGNVMWLTNVEPEYTWVC